jgi:hypothetical protein
MKLKINLQSIEWWYWLLTLIAMIAGLLSVVTGFYLVIAISIVQFIHFSIKNGITAFPTQVRFVYAILSIFALFDPTRIFYLLLLVGTVMVTFFDRCMIARVLALMPWNKGVKIS